MAFAVFIIGAFCGAFAVAAQAYLAREFLSVFRGNEMSLAVLLAGWLAGVAAGARLARARFLLRARPAYVVTLAVLTWVVLFPAAVTVIRVSRGIVGVEPGLLAPLGKIMLAALLFAGPFAAFGGLTFVALCRLAEGVPGRLKPVALVYVAEAVGGMAGGALFTFIFAGRIPPYTFGFAVPVAAAASLIVVVVAARRSGGLARATAASAITGTAIIAIASTALLLTHRDATLERNSGISRMLTIAGGLTVDSRESRYENVTTLLSSGQYTVYGNGEACFTFPEPLLAERDAFLVLCEHADPKNVLVVGGGPDFLQGVLAYGVEHVDYVELDSAVIDAARPFLERRALDALDSPRVSVQHVDARAFVERAAAEGPRYDVIFVRTGDPSTLLLNRLHTREFLLAARASLRGGGVLVTPATLAEGYLQGEVGRYAGDMYRTMRSVFDEVLVTPDTTALFFGSVGKGTLTPDVATLSERFLRRGVRSDLYPALFASAFPPERTREVNALLAALPPGALNTDWHPTTYVSNLALWARYSGSRLAGLFLKAADAPRAVLFAALALLAAAGALAGRRRRGACAPPVAILYTGAAAMSMTVILIYAFQVEYGYVYNWIGALVGAFVAGLAIGGLAGNGAGARRLALADMFVTAMPVAMLGVLSAAPSVVGPDAGRFLILGLAAAAGFVTGFQFPIAAAALQARGAAEREAGGILETADHLGACLGALLTGVMIVPALGIWWSLALLAVAKAATLAVVLASSRRA